MTTLSLPAMPASYEARGYAPPAPQDRNPVVVVGLGAASLFFVAALLMTDYTGIAAVLAGVAGIITAVGSVWIGMRKQDVALMEKLIEGRVKQEVERRLGGPVEPDSSEAAPEPEKPHRERKRRPPKAQD